MSPGMNEDFAGGLCRHEKRSGTPMGLHLLMLMGLKQCSSEALAAVCETLSENFQGKIHSDITRHADVHQLREGGQVKLCRTTSGVAITVSMGWSLIEAVPS